MWIFWMLSSATGWDSNAEAEKVINFFDQAEEDVISSSEFRASKSLW